MSTFRQLKPADVLFVGGETRNVYQHTAGLFMMDTRGKAGISFEDFRTHTAERLADIPQFRWKLHEVPLGLDLPYWVEDEQFSFDHHIHRIAVPSPGDNRALGEVVSHLYCHHLDRNKPLWELWYIEGLANGRCALLQKMHHCMMDGEGASKLAEIIWDYKPRGARRKVDPAIANARPGQVPQQWQEAINAARRLSGLPLRVTREISVAFWHGLSKRATRKGKPEKKPGAPRASFNADIGSDRGFVFGSLPLADILAIKNILGVTVNDVVLALVGGSLRDYLLAQGALPEQSLRTSIAISLRKAGDDDFSNKVTVAAVTLATNTADPAERIRAIAQESAAAKQEARSGGKGVLEFMQMLPPLLVNALVRGAPADKVAEIMGVNVVVSNVRGSPKPMYIAGTRINAVYPMSIISPGGGLNITCF
ncbi:MAG: wax ester/triacylglycerol synthase family O-acyltransferase, partial [Halioglobus sp.]|nr:wax ester/triacylglycerol synthase family O-acyltransferase [Halioglobus sp.]